MAASRLLEVDEIELKRGRKQMAYDTNQNLTEDEKKLAISDDRNDRLTAVDLVRQRLDCKLLTARDIVWGYRSFLIGWGRVRTRPQK